MKTRPEEMLELLRARPFEQFRIYLSDGAVYDVYHPDMAIVRRTKITIGVP